MVTMIGLPITLPSLKIATVLLPEKHLTAADFNFLLSTISGWRDTIVQPVPLPEDVAAKLPQAPFRGTNETQSQDST